MNSLCNAVRLGALGAAMAGFVLAASPARADHIEKHFTVQSKPIITVRNASGRVQVKAWSKNEVQVTWTNAGGKTAVETEQAGNRIEIATHAAEERAAAEDLKTDFEITVPVESELRVRTDSGIVTVESVHGDMTFDTVGANLQLSDVDWLHGDQDDRRLAGVYAVRGKTRSELDQRQYADDPAHAGQRPCADFFRKHPV